MYIGKSIYGGKRRVNGTCKKVATRSKLQKGHWWFVESIETLTCTPCLLKLIP